MRRKEKENKVSRWYGYLKYSSIGLEMGLSVGAGALIGYWLDSKLGTKPWMFVFWFFCGLVASFRSLFKLAKKYMKNSELKNENKDAE